MPTFCRPFYLLTLLAVVYSLGVQRRDTPNFTSIQGACPTITFQNPSTLQADCFVAVGGEEELSTTLNLNECLTNQNGALVAGVAYVESCDTNTSQFDPIGITLTVSCLTSQGTSQTASVVLVNKGASGSEFRI
ncbi:hypothetical protein FB45DRAFT_1034043 [Roridomyces roridus]|uniref:Cyanovirin-N domain-containing protein n=1 Tax=Roridomyces roridus TaxID=1738132 RepID=A0AAD7BD60_9AGAR|nr:hypothetical protein FB45DRAFT_1034043 [Roridomyces roridus]